MKAKIYKDMNRHLTREVRKLTTQFRKHCTCCPKPEPEKWGSRLGAKTGREDVLPERWDPEQVLPEGRKGREGVGYHHRSHVWEWGVTNVKVYSVLFGIETTISKNTR